MNANQTGAAADRPSAPPTTAGPLPPPETSATWATVIGVVAIVLGVLGTFGGIWGILSPLLMQYFDQVMPGYGLVTETTRAWAAWTISLSAVAAVLGLLLLAGGVGLVRRRHWSRAALICWALLKIILAVANGLVVWAVQQHALQEQSRMLGPGFAPGGPGATTVEAVAVLGMALTILWGWALPVFLLIWFSRRSIKAQMAQWR